MGRVHVDETGAGCAEFETEGTEEAAVAKASVEEAPGVGYAEFKAEGTNAFGFEAGDAASVIEDDEVLVEGTSTEGKEFLGAGDMAACMGEEVLDAGDMGADTGEEVLVAQDMVASELGSFYEPESRRGGIQNHNSFHTGHSSSHLHAQCSPSALSSCVSVSASGGGSSSVGEGVHLRWVVGRWSARLSSCWCCPGCGCMGMGHGVHDV